MNQQPLFESYTMTLIHEAVSQDLDRDIDKNVAKIANMLNEIEEYVDEMDKKGKLSTKQSQIIHEHVTKAVNLLEKYESTTMSKMEYYTQLVANVAFLLINIIAIAIGLGMVPGVALLLGPAGVGIATFFAVLEIYRVFNLLKEGAPSEEVKRKFLNDLKSLIKSDPRRLFKK